FFNLFNLYLIFIIKTIKDIFINYDFLEITKRCYTLINKKKRKLMLIKNKLMFAIICQSVLALLMQGCARIEIRSLAKPQINMIEYRTFTTVNQAKPEEQNHLRDEVLLEHVSNVLTQMNYSESSPRTAKSRITLVFNEGFEKVFVPPSTQPIISYTEGEFTTVTGKINGETVSLFGYIPPRRIERYVKIPAYKIDVYKLMLRIDIYDARTLTMIWSGTANMESSQGRAIEDAKKMIGKLVRERLPEL
ncbi:MAG: DUF4136 domain-containing protein, partial [Thermodesulfovibrionia bacterium]|nr:DUF4136 domain-containing protein [Thermodesulfovibrionia bacterium]